MANHPENSKSRTSARFNLTSAGLAFLFWGGWAWWINSRADDDADRASPLVSGLVQGTGSFLITLIMVGAVTWIFHRMPDSPIRLVLPAVLVVLVTGTTMATAHAIAGTANIATTIAPPLITALLFNILTAFQLQRGS